MSCECSCCRSSMKIIENIWCDLVCTQEDFDNFQCSKDPARKMCSQPTSKVSKTIKWMELLCTKRLKFRELVNLNRLTLAEMGHPKLIQIILFLPSSSIARHTFSGMNSCQICPDIVQRLSQPKGSFCDILQLDFQNGIPGLQFNSCKGMDV